MNVGGIVLCGGQSRRMARPKAWLPFAGDFMLPHVVRRLSAAVDPVVVVAAPDQDVPPLPPGVAIVRDEEKGRGPLQGLAAGLAALRGRAEAAFLSSCDVPFLRAAFVRRLIELLADRTICVPHVGGYHHPLAAVYRLEAAAAVKTLLAEDRLRPVFLFDTVPTRVVEAADLAEVDPTLESLRNLNTPEEYEAAPARGGGSRPPLARNRQFTGNERLKERIVSAAARFDPKPSRILPRDRNRDVKQVGRQAFFHAVGPFHQANAIAFEISRGCPIPQTRRRCATGKRRSDKPAAGRRTLESARTWDC